jgi:imidazolonepropionase-like amidohydrolase
MCLGTGPHGRHGRRSLSAESHNLQNDIGSIAPGLQADIIACDGDGDPLKDITVYNASCSS